MRVITVKDYWMYWIKVLKKFEGKTISIYDLFRSIFGDYDVRLKLHFVKVFNALKARDLVRGDIMYKMVGRRMIPHVYIEKVVNFKVLNKWDDKVKLIVFYDEETLKNYLNNA